MTRGEETQLGRKTDFGLIPRSFPLHSSHGAPKSPRQAPASRSCQHLLLPRAHSAQLATAWNMAGVGLVRLGKELKMLTDEPPPGVCAWPVDDCITHLQARELPGKACRAPVENFCVGVLDTPATTIVHRVVLPSPPLRARCCSHTAAACLFTRGRRD